MKKYLKAFRKNAGFTLIELLVVIGILGVLAAALIATIDPFEQLKKAQDANVKNTTVEFVNANIRYYTTHNVLPWSDTAAPAACQNGGNPVAATLGAAKMSSCLNALITDGELKSGFTTVTSILNSILISGGTNSVTSCFLPQSKSQERDQNTKYASDGTPGANCVATGGNATTCYWCSQ
ncbi:MAG TPA: type II secretion system protein [Candidatus Sulfotelmatobacter sp.]|nr:type II secretion system protein [Candidatus Sulfotelmatobacter sp.]